MRLSGLSNEEVAAGWGDVAHALLEIGLPPAGMLRVVLPFAAVDYRSHSLHTHSPGLANRTGANGDGPKGAGTGRALVTIRGNTNKRDTRGHLWGVCQKRPFCQGSRKAWEPAPQKAFPTSKPVSKSWGQKSPYRVVLTRGEGIKNSTGSKLENRWPVSHECW